MVHADKPSTQTDQTVRRFDIAVIAVIVTVVLAMFLAVYRFANLEADVKKLNRDGIDAVIAEGIEEIQAKSTSVGDMPVGAILPFAGTKDDAPDGWLLCDGAPLPDHAQFKSLRDILAAGRWERSAAITLLPDLRGRFLRGLDKPKGGEAALRDTQSEDRGVGSPQAQTRGSHTHKAGDMVAQINPSGGEVPLNLRSASWTAQDCLEGVKAKKPNPRNKAMTLGVIVSGESCSECAFAHDENRPENCAVNYIIKY